MSEQRHLKPAPGRRVRKPDGTVLAEAGEFLPLDTYWTRRIAEGDVVEVEPSKAKGK